jgi:hypothetical protein
MKDRRMANDRAGKRREGRTVRVLIALVVVAVLAYIVIDPIDRVPPKVLRTVRKMKAPGSDRSLKTVYGDYIADAKWHQFEDPRDGTIYVNVSGKVMWGDQLSDILVQYEIEEHTSEGNDYISAELYAVVINDEPLNALELAVFLLALFRN